VPENVTRELTHLPGVHDVEGMRTVPVRFRNGHRRRDSALYGLPDAPRLRHIVNRDGELVEMPEHGLAISRKLAEVLDLAPGGTVEVEIREGNRGWYTLTVTMLVDDAFGMQGYMRLSPLHEFLGEQVSINSVQLKVDPQLYNEVHERLEELPQVARVTRKQAFIDRFYEQTGSTMWVMTLILTLCAATIAVGVVYNNARVALSMRSRDLASLRVLGFKRSEISAVLLGELAIQILLALPIGLLLGRWWSIAMMSTVDPEVYRMPIVIAVETYAFAVAVTVGAGLASALLVRRKLDHLDLIGVLKTRE
jgi:putative ABC transport system permease protein